MANVQGPITTIPPFTNTEILPSCATLCGPLYDANGACVPPGGPPGDDAAYTACFCSHQAVNRLSTVADDVCNGVCPEAGMTSIANWFRDICSVGNNDNGNGNNGGNNNGNQASTSTRGGSSSGSNGSVNNGGGGDWLSNHWQWVIMLVILVVGITGIWVGACIWRRRYLRKRDRQATLTQKQSGSANHPSWGPDAAAAATAGTGNSAGPGIFMPGTAAADGNYEEKTTQSRVKKWLVSERT
ncbi:hypothetical protein B0I35DRAFT_56612 [Stachybotrys elegans]|uniref:Integral membrane protein n=1 Tax=Stachybotrys elegans TaxID=80388 RepID=A0A8K0WNN5_9HYPO|nr:hypothetical protein B0I35DRAFT_56612 [Stachybotrys elegans]